MGSISEDSAMFDLKIRITELEDEVAYLKVQMDQLRKVSVFYENELQRILDQEDFENLIRDCMHMLLLDPHKYDEDE